MFDNIVSVTPDDNNDLAVPSRGILVSVAGTIAVTDINGNDVTLTATQIVAGTIYPLQIKRIKSTGTSATGILSLS